MEEWTVMLQERPIKTFSIEEGGRVTIGRGSEADVVIDNTAISRVHAALELQNGVYFISDLKSLNGTMVNGERITEMVPISKTDTIDVGKFRLIPAALETGQHVSSSTVTSMDLDDETVFVTSKKAAPSSKQPPVGKDKEGPFIVVLQGDARPDRLSVKGKSSIKIGKDASCEVVIGGWFVAAAQCYIIKRDEKFYIVPQRSWASTRLNGLQIKDERPLHKGDIIEIRSTKLQFG
ncbi:MAG: FHA domain-containing protein [Desulfobulbaceae bacterium]|nr:FHA domain-containing protein [Desulfobulbaceae bacterium]